MWGRGWLLAGVAVCAAAMAGPPPTPGTQQPPAAGTQSPPGATQSPPQGESDEDFIEFLGADDVGDTAWWEFLKKAPPRGGNPPPPPAQDTKQ
jgi:hypothetical protein